MYGVMRPPTLEGWLREPPELLYCPGNFLSSIAFYDERGCSLGCMYAYEVLERVVTGIFCAIDHRYGLGLTRERVSHDEVSRMPF